MMKLILKDYRDLLENLPSWIEQRLTPVSYAPRGQGIVIEVKEIKPKLKLPYLSNIVPGLTISRHFTVAEVSEFLAQYGGTKRNYAVYLDGKCYHILNPFIVARSKRIHVSPDELELANILCNANTKDCSIYTEFLAAKYEGKKGAPRQTETDYGSEYGL